MKQQLRREIGVRMRKIRKTLAFTQDQMVSYFPIGRANYSRIEKGEIFPVAPILNILRTEFNVSLDWLVSSKGAMFLSESKEGEGKINFGDYSEEIRDLLFHMSKVPMLKHAVLSFFIEYKMKNKQLINQILQAVESTSAT